MPSRRVKIIRRAALAVAAAGTVGVLSACQVKDDGDNLVAGKEAFVQRCGSCHVLKRAGTTGVSGPNLDDSFSQALSEGFGRDTIEGVVREQIEAPNKDAQTDPRTGKKASGMPANLVTGETAEDVAAYVAFATARRGEDTGRLAELGVKKATETAQAENGTLEIPADPSGALAFLFAEATAEAGTVTLQSVNESSVPHNIAVEGGGIDEKGEVVQDGGVSEIRVDLEAGTEYTFYCSVPGHREGGMLGPLKVE